VSCDGCVSPCPNPPRCTRRVFAERHSEDLPRTTPEYARLGRSCGRIRGSSICGVEIGRRWKRRTWFFDALSAAPGTTRLARQHEAAKRDWNPSSLPDWLNETAYREKILPRLGGLTVRAISDALGISIPYASGFAMESAFRIRDFGRKLRNLLKAIAFEISRAATVTKRARFRVAR
jgi:hypothetical protein